jgi:5'-nucleotidase
MFNVVLICMSMYGLYASVKEGAEFGDASGSGIKKVPRHGASSPALRETWGDWDRYASLMRILLTNDDGIRAPGLAAMYEALVGAPAGGRARFDGPLVDVSAGAVHRSPRSVVEAIAPLDVQSAMSHGITVHEPLMVREEAVRLSDGRTVAGMSVDGRPADCVKLAISQLWPEKFGAGSRPDLVVSGMNQGANCGINVIYSGTVAAALEGAFLGVPSIAVSLRIGKGRPRFDLAAERARRAIELLIAEGLPAPHECLNINVPLTEEEGSEEMPEVVVCPMNTHGLVDKFERRVSPYGDVYYWAAGHGLEFHGTEKGSDVEELLAGKITVTPLGYDLTKREGVGRWRGRVGRK